MNASDVSGIAYYWVNDTARFAIDASGVLTSTGCLAVGIYWVEIRAYDPLHNYCSATIQIMVQDTLDPTWVQPPVDQVNDYGFSFVYNINVSYSTRYTE